MFIIKNKGCYWRLLKRLPLKLNGFRINIDQEGVGIDQVQAFINQDRANALDYNYDNVPSYEITEGFKKRYKRHKEWLKKVYQ